MDTPSWLGGITVLSLQFPECRAVGIECLLVMTRLNENNGLPDSAKQCAQDLAALPTRLDAANDGGALR